jgi:hypothetical protein
MLNGVRNSNALDPLFNLSTIQHCNLLKLHRHATVHGQYLPRDVSSRLTAEEGYG